MNSILIASLGLYVTNKKVSLSCYGDKKYNLDDGFSSIISCSKLIICIELRVDYKKIRLLWLTIGNFDYLG